MCVRTYNCMYIRLYVIAYVCISAASARAPTHKHKHKHKHTDTQTNTHRCQKGVAVASCNTTSHVNTHTLKHTRKLTPLKTHANSLSHTHAQIPNRLPRAPPATPPRIYKHTNLKQLGHAELHPQRNLKYTQDIQDLTRNFANTQTKHTHS